MGMCQEIVQILGKFSSSTQLLFLTRSLSILPHDPLPLSAGINEDQPTLDEEFESKDVSLQMKIDISSSLTVFYFLYIIIY